MNLKSSCSIKYIDVKKRAPLSCKGYQALVWELVRHLLYMRNQIPSLYEDLHWQVQVLERDKELQQQAKNSAGIEGGEDLQSDTPAHAACRKPKRRLQTNQKRSRKFVNSVESLMALLTPETFASEMPSHIIIALGSTPSRPLELYSLALPAAACRDQSAETSTEDLVRRSIRSLVMNTQDMPEGKASGGPTKLFVLLHGAYEVAPPGFTYKRGLQIRMRKGIQVHINLTNSFTPACAEESLPSQPAFLSAGEEESGMRWYQCQIAVKGLRHPGNRDDGGSG